MTSSQHDPVLHITVGQINDSIEQEGSSSGPRKPSADQLGTVG